MATASLVDLLPSLFDSAVLQLTRRDLLSVERNAISTAVVNGLGESVMRRVRHTASATSDVEASASKDITEIETFDRFSDEWMPRLEIIENIECSSGLSRTLSEFALFLMESRLDSILGIGASTIVGIGQVTPVRDVHEIRPTSEEVFKRLDKAFMEVTSAESRGQTFWRRLFGPPVRSLAERLVEEAQLIAMLREPLAYKIVLAETLAFKSDKRAETKISIEATEKNRVIDKSIRLVGQDSQIPLPKAKTKVKSVLRT